MPRGKATKPAKHQFIPANSIPPGLEFDPRKRISSPYDEVLVDLRDNRPTEVLRFDSVSCRNSLKVRSNKLGIKLHFAEDAGALFVRLADFEKRQAEQRLNTDSDKDVELAWIKEALAAKYDTPLKIVGYISLHYAKKLRAITDVQPRLTFLLQKGVIRLKTRKADTVEDRYELIPAQK